jgi:hypothetical protein
MTTGHRRNPFDEDSGPCPSLASGGESEAQAELHGL